MIFDYLGNFPIPAAVLPVRLRLLLEPVDLSPRQLVEVTSRYESTTQDSRREHLHMIMAVVADDDPEPLQTFSESSNGVVSYSVPFADEKGCSREFTPSISGHDYIVASWGNGSFYTYNLAEKVWMALGLTPRCVGNDNQRIIYDDLSIPEFGVAEGEVSGEYYFKSSRNISWKISNEYLRKYLWMRGAHGVRVFFYETLLEDGPELRSLMNGKAQVILKPDDGWYELDIREHRGDLLIQVWASVKAVPPEPCPEQSANGILWPGVAGPMTHARANALVEETPVLLSDKFLQKYEQNRFYDTTPVNIYGDWHCSPSYHGQWSFTNCVRVGRNLVRVSMRELYKPKPDREILHAHAFAIGTTDIAHLDLEEEHIVAKTQRLLDQILDLGDNLSALGEIVGISKSALDLVYFSRREVAANGWAAYPQLCRLAQVAPLDMSQQAFLSRCKSLHEIWQRVPDGFLKQILEKAGCPRTTIKQLGSLKLLQALLNIIERLNTNEETRDAFENNSEPEGWNKRSKTMAPLFLNNDLRIADAHETIGEILKTIQDLGFDTANVNDGYGRALDFVMDGVINAFGSINKEIANLLKR